MGPNLTRIQISCIIRARITSVKKPCQGVPVFRTRFGSEELEAVQEVFQSGWLGPGPRVAEFEEAFAREVDAPHAIAVNSGTAALHLVCLALGLGPGDEVLVPAITFVATAHAPAFCGASIVFVDVDPQTCNLDPEDLRRKIGPRSRGVIPVHYAGHPAVMQDIWAEAERHGLWVIEDAAHACGSRYRDRAVGGMPESAAACFSFNAVKNLSTGDGGIHDSPAGSGREATSPALDGDRQGHLRARGSGLPATGRLGPCCLRVVLRGHGTGAALRHERHYSGAGAGTTPEAGPDASQAPGS